MCSVGSLREPGCGRRAGCVRKRRLSSQFVDCVHWSCPFDSQSWAAPSRSDGNPRSAAAQVEIGPGSPALARHFVLEVSASNVLMIELLLLPPVGEGISRGFEQQASARRGTGDVAYVDGGCEPRSKCFAGHDLFVWIVAHSSCFLSADHSCAGQFFAPDGSVAAAVSKTFLFGSHSHPWGHRLANAVDEA